MAKDVGLLRFLVSHVSRKLLIGFVTSGRIIFGGWSGPNLKRLTGFGMVVHFNDSQRCDSERVPDRPVHNVSDLTNGGSLATIMLDGQAYTLRITRARKLILTK